MLFKGTVKTKNVDLYWNLGFTKKLQVIVMSHTMFHQHKAYFYTLVTIYSSNLYEESKGQLYLIVKFPLF